MLLAGFTGALMARQPSSVCCFVDVRFHLVLKEQHRSNSPGCDPGGSGVLLPEFHDEFGCLGGNGVLFALPWPLQLAELR